MQSGDLRHRIQWQAITRVSDGGGGFVNLYVAVPGFESCPASIWGIKGEEQFSGGRTVAIASKRVRIRFKRGFSSAWRGKDLCHFSGKYLSVVSSPIDIGDEHKWIEVLVKEVTA